MKNSGFISVAVAMLIMAGVFVVGGGVVYLVMKSSPASDTAANEVEGAKWKTHTSNLGISFQYPADWVVNEGNDYPGSTQGNDYVSIAKGSEMIYASAKRDCLQEYTYCKPSGDTNVYPYGYPYFSTQSTNQETKNLIDAIIKTVVRLNESTNTAQPVLTILAPTEATSLRVGTTQRISWKSENLFNPIVTIVLIDSLKKGEEGTIRIAPEVPASQGYYVWSIPATLRAGAYRIHIFMPDPNPNAPYISDEQEIVISASATLEAFPEALVQEAILAFKNKDVAKIASLAHPVQGIRFSPYAYVTKEDIVFTRTAMSAFFVDTKVYAWGVTDGKGDPINLTPREYYEKYVYNADYANAPQISYTETIRQGNTMNNAKEFYPNAVVVEYHFPGFNPEFQGMDWTSLRLVFQKYEGEWKLIGVIKDNWTI